MPFPWELNSDRPYRHETYPAPRSPSTQDHEGLAVIDDADAAKKISGK
ncbi:hypothetical protein [Mycobacterium sp. 1164985.4]|nr:hypothetical protein [Mycobacterium sp. 1164985.4]